MRTAKLSVPEGALLHEMGGDVDEPSQVKSIGNVPPSSMAELETVNSLAGVSEGADELVVVVVVAEPEQAEMMPRARDIPMMKIRLRCRAGMFTAVRVFAEGKEKL
jgi:hypothetical protein